jgi:hypothetical protein
MIRRFSPGVLSLLLGIAVSLASVAGAAPAKEHADTAGPATEAAGLVRQLESDDFTTREQAQSRLKSLVDHPGSRQDVEAELRRAWLSPNISAEARALLEPICGRLPDAGGTAGNADVARIDRQIAQLDSSTYSQREAALLELEPMAKRMPQAWALGERLKLALDKPDASLEARRQMHALWHAARGTWLRAPESAASAPPVDNRRIEAWIDALAADDGSPAANPLQADNAERQLLDLLARDAYVTRVKQALEKRLAVELPEGLRRRITTLIGWAWPAMVAEYWEAGHHKNIQHLLVGIPSHPEGAQRASHFDHCDERRAHCVSGNSLSPGDWPVGVFFPHPLRLDAMFHLVNLPTPRRRMAYEYEVERDEQTRLAEFTEQTVKRLLAGKRSLVEREIVMLGNLEPHAVSRFAGEYLVSVADEPVAAVVSVDTAMPMDLRMFASRHNMLCHLLVRRGTHEAAPGLMRACLEGKVLAPTDEAPYQLSWIASLAIAQRDPWPEADAWLESLLPRGQLLASELACPGQLGATAAGILLDRHGVSPEAFGLEAVTDEEMLVGMRLTPYRYRSSSVRDRALSWWPQFKRQLAARPARSP